MLKEVWTVDFCVEQTENDDYTYLMELQDRVFATKELAIEFFHNEMKRMECLNVVLEDKADNEEWFAYSFTTNYNHWETGEKCHDKCGALILCKQIMFNSIDD